MSTIDCISSVVEAAKTLTDGWSVTSGEYDLWVYGPGGFVREFKGNLTTDASQAPVNIEARYDIA